MNANIPNINCTYQVVMKNLRYRFIIWPEFVTAINLSKSIEDIFSFFTGAP